MRFALNANFHLEMVVCDLLSCKTCCKPPPLYDAVKEHNCSYGVAGDTKRSMSRQAGGKRLVIHVLKSPEQKI